MTDLFLNITGTAALVLPILFMAVYFAYGNRFRAPAGRAIMVWAGGSGLLGSIFFIHHPVGISTGRHGEDAVVSWYQITGITIFVIGVIWLIALGVRANGRWPWRRDRWQP